jgi:uncharacterized protein (TIGR02246 family)
MPVSAAAPAEVVTLLADALQDGRVDDALSLYEGDAVFIPQPDSQPVAGHDAIRDALTRFAALRPVMTADIRKVVTAGDVATVLNTWQLHGTTPDGEPIDMSGTSADVMRRRANGTWGILIDDPWGVQPSSG